MSQLEGSFFTEASIQQFLFCMEQNEDPLRKMVVVERMIIEVISCDLESGQPGFLNIVMPPVVQFVDSMLDKNITLLSLNVDKEDILNDLRQCLQINIEILKSINILLEFIESKNNIEWSLVEGLPTNILKIVHSIFAHCKQSKDIYNTFFESLEEILQMFKMAQEINRKQLLLLCGRIKFNMYLEEDKLALPTVLESILDVIQVVTGVNMKSVGDSWKGYLNIIKLYSEHLQYDLNISRPFQIISSEIMRTFKEMDMTITSPGEIVTALKMTNFMLKISCHIFDNYWELCKMSERSTLEFFTTIYSIDGLYSKSKEISDDVLLAVNQLYSLVDEYLYKVFILDDILKNNNINAEICKNIGFYIIIAKMLNRTDLDNSNILNYFQAILKFTNKGSVLFSMDLKINNENLYQHLVTQFVGKFLSMNQQEFEILEKLLMETAFNGNVFQATIAMDIWIILLRHVPQPLKYETLLNILDLYRIKSNAQLQRYSTNKYCRIGNFSRSIYYALPDSYKEQMLVMFPIEDNLDVWRLIGLKDVPRNKANLKLTLIKNVGRRIDLLEQGKYGISDLIFIINGLNLLSTIPAVDFKNQDFVKHLMKLWNFDLSRAEVADNIFIRSILAELCKLTANLILEFDDPELQHILTQLPDFTRTNDPYLKTCTSHLLASLFTQLSKFQPQQGVLSELLKTVLSDENPVIKQKGLLMIDNLMETGPPQQNSPTNFAPAPPVHNNQTDEGALRETLGDMKIELVRILKMASSRKVSQDVMELLRDISTLLVKRLKSNYE